MPVTGIKEVKANIKRVFKDIANKKAPQFVTAVVNHGVAASKELTPIAYANLINSIVINFDVVNGKATGEVFYMADYALYLNGSETYTPLWKPRKAPKYAVTGTRKRKDGTYATPDVGAPADNMDATPRFLNRGFEDPENVQVFEKMKEIFKI